MSRYIHKSHNVTVLLYHLVFPAKYRRAVIDAAVDHVLRAVCLEIEARYQLRPCPETKSLILQTFYSRLDRWMSPFQVSGTVEA